MFFIFFRGIAEGLAGLLPFVCVSLSLSSSFSSFISNPPYDLSTKGRRLHRDRRIFSIEKEKEYKITLHVFGSRYVAYVDASGSTVRYFTSATVPRWAVAREIAVIQRLTQKDTRVDRVLVLPRSWTEPGRKGRKNRLESGYETLARNQLRDFHCDLNDNSLATREVNGPYSGDAES